MNKETATMRRIQLEATKSPDCRLYRNNVGMGWQGRRGIVRTIDLGAPAILDPRPVKFGLCEGSSDLVGWQAVTITPEMVGRRVAVFVGLEVKEGRAKPTKEQQHFLDVVRAAGGVAEVVNGVAAADIALSTAFLPRL